MLKKFFRKIFKLKAEQISIPAEIDVDSWMDFLYNNPEECLISFVEQNLVPAEDVDTLNEKQFDFSIMLAALVMYMYIQGVKIQFGDVKAFRGHKNFSLHYISLAGDLNMFKYDSEKGVWVYQTDGNQHRPFGAFWKRLRSGAIWGGDFKSVNDGNHYSVEHEGRW